MKQGDLSGADKCFRKAIEHNKDDSKRSLYVSTLKECAVLLRRLGKPAEADKYEAEAFGINYGLLK